MNKLFFYIAVMAVSTYIIRVTPFLIFRKEIKNKYVRSFLYYVPYATLSAMTFPAVLDATGNIYAGAVGLLISVVLAFFEKPIPVVAAFACAGAFVTQYVCTIM